MRFAASKSSKRSPSLAEMKMPSSSIIRGTIPEAPRPVPAPSLLHAVDERTQAPTAGTTTWQERWSAQGLADETADSVVAAAWIQAQQIRRQAQTEGQSEGYA